MLYNFYRLLLTENSHLRYRQKNDNTAFALYEKIQKAIAHLEIYRHTVINIFNSSSESYKLSCVFFGKR